MYERAYVHSHGPFLKALTSSNWFSFVDSLEAFRARGFDTPIKLLISSLALKTITRVIPDVLQIDSSSRSAAPSPVSSKNSVASDDSEDEAVSLDLKSADDAFIKAVTQKFFAPRDQLVSYDRFKKIFMSANSCDIDAVLNYISRYEREESICASALPPDKKLRKLFIKGLKPSRLSARVEFLDPSTLDEAKQSAIEQVDHLLSISRELGADPSISISALHSGFGGLKFNSSSSQSKGASMSPGASVKPRQGSP
jgi:hypothetical protein